MIISVYHNSSLHLAWELKSITHFLEAMISFSLVGSEGKLKGRNLLEPTRIKGALQISRGNEGPDNESSFLLTQGM